MKFLFHFLPIILFTINAQAQVSNGTKEEMQSLNKHITALNEAFAKGDAAAVGRLHHPDVVKYFGGSNVITGRNAVEKGAESWFSTASVEFVDNIIESTVFNGETAIQTSIFTIKNTPKATGKSELSRGRAMVIYVRDNNSSTGWLTLREMAQAAPEK